MKTWKAMAIGAAIGAAAVLLFSKSDFAWRYSTRSFGIAQIETRRNIITGETWDRMPMNDWRRIGQE